MSKMINCLLLVCLLILSGCSSKNIVEKTQSKMTRDKKTITILTDIPLNQSKALEELLSQYQKEHPQFVFEVNDVPESGIKSTISAMGVSGKYPDLYYLSNNVIKLMNSKSLIASFPSELSEELIKANPSTLLEPLKIAGGYWGYPVNSSPYVLVYNEKILNSLGISPPETWVELITIAKNLSSSEANLGFGFPWGWSSLNTELWSALYLANGGNDSSNLKASETKEGMETTQFIKTFGQFDLEGQSEFENSQFGGYYSLNESTVMTIIPSIWIAYLGKNGQDDYQIAPMPVGPSFHGKVKPYFNGKVLMVSSKGNHQKDCWDLAQWLAKNGGKSI